MSPTVKLFVFSIIFLAQQMFAAAKFPFPQDQAYGKGIKPTTTNHNDVQAAYDIFLQNYYEVNGDQARIKWDTPDQTVSEGIGYGMLIFVFMDNAKNNTQEKFDKLWKYYQNHLDGSGLMNWKITGFGGVVGSNGATDGDIDVAFALALAYYQWGDEKYKTAANSMSGKVFSSEVSGSILKPGDDPNFTSPYNPSYFITAGLNFFDKHQTDFGSHNWSGVVSWCYQTLSNCSNKNSTGLVPDWCDGSGNPQTKSGSGTTYGFDAARTPWRMGWAYCWYGDAGAKSVMDKMTSWIKQKTSGTPAQIVDGYKLDGTATGKDNIVTYLGPFACAAMSDASQQQWLDDCYTRMSSFTGDDGYYNQLIKVLTLLLLTGNCLDLSNATPKTDFNIKTAVVPSDGGTITVTPSGPYKAGASVTIKVKPSGVYQFTSWGGDLSGTDTVKTVTVSSDMNITAYFNAGRLDLIDDCDHAGSLTRIGTRWFSYNDSTSKGQSTVSPGNPFSMSDSGFNDSGSAAKISYTLKKGQASTPFVGMGFSLTLSDSGLDISKATSLTFYYKGDSGDVRVETANITDAAFYYRTVPQCKTWKQISVQWSEMKQPAWSKNGKPFDRTKATKIAWQTPNTVKDGQTGAIWVDEIHLPGFVVPTAIRPMVTRQNTTNGNFAIKQSSASVKLSYSLSTDNNPSVCVFDLTGRLVQKISLGERIAGNYAEAMDLSKIAVPSGAYLIRLQADRNSCGSRVIITK